MFFEKKNIANWGNFPRQDAVIFQPTNRAELPAFVKAQTGFTCRGAGKCYGDAALGTHIVSTQNLDKMLAFDPITGIIEAESGVLLENVLRLVVPLGWFFHVTPGIKSITLGGAVASDVHGKNHVQKGCFSDHLLDFDLLQADGQIVFCSKNEAANLFWQSCGGMGWTGLILRVRFQLMPIVSSFMEKETVRLSSFSSILQTFHQRAHDYGAAWIDMQNKEGRGVVFFAKHLEKPQAVETEGLEYQEQKKLNIPCYFPHFTLNRISMSLYNALFFRKNKNSTSIVSMDAYFYPLDGIGHWNRLYGRRGFIQYQCLIPSAEVEKTLAAIQKTLSKTQHRPFLSVLKQHRKRPVEALHSFPEEGFSLAMDFKRKAGIEQLVADLDAIVWAAGGKIYLAKDALSGSKMSKIDPISFGNPCFTSVQKKRIGENSFRACFDFSA